MIKLFWLDDASLSPKAVRLLICYACDARNNRVTMRLGQASRVCRMTPGSVKAAELELVAAGLLEARGKRCFVLTLPAEAVPVTTRGAVPRGGIVLG